MSGRPFPRPEGPLTDGVITLRDWRESDIPSIVRICQDPQISRFTRVPSPYTDDDAVLFVQRHAEQELGFATASQKVATRAGFRREGVLRSYMLLKGERHDAVVYGLVPEDLR